VPKFNTDHLAAKFTNNYFQLQAANTDVSRAIQCFITKNNITFHTFLHPSEPKLNVLLRVKPILLSPTCVVSKDFSSRTRPIRDWLKTMGTQCSAILNVQTLISTIITTVLTPYLFRYGLITPFIYLRYLTVP